MVIDVTSFSRNINFVVSDKDTKDPPKDFEELKRRCDEIKPWIPQPKRKIQGNNAIFTALIFTLFKDLGFVNKRNVELLNDANWCNSVFGIRMNPLGGVLRREDLTLCDSNLRYYCPYNDLKAPSDIATANMKKWKATSKLAVICEGVTYYISNDWFAPGKGRPTKSTFYNWFMRCLIRKMSKVIDDARKNELIYSSIAPLESDSPKTSETE